MNRVYCLLLLAFSLTFVGTLSSQTCMNGKHLPRTNPNLFDTVYSPAFGQFETALDTDPWLHYDLGCYCGSACTPLWSGLPGANGQPGCLQLIGPDNSASGTCSSINYDMVRIFDFPIEGGKTYTLSIKSKTKSVCPSPVMHLQLQGSGPNTQNNTYPAAQRNYRFSHSEPNVWQEFSFQFRLPDDVYKTMVTIRNWANETPSTIRDTSYVDELYIGEGISFELPPTPKTPFDGGRVRIDELGNFEVKDSLGNWQWFFPWGIYGDGYRKLENHGPGPQDDGFNIYSQQGFNSAVTGAAFYQLDDMVNAGMLGIPHLGFYYPTGVTRDTIAFAAYLQYVKDNHNDNILMWNIDNEVHPSWDSMAMYTKFYQDWHRNNYPDGKIQHPMYSLNGSSGLAPKYNSSNCYIADITGSYISFYSSDSVNTHATNWRINAQDHWPQQNMPVNIAQINGNALFRARIWGSIAHGTRGMMFWRDYAPLNPDYLPSLDITNAQWWNGFPALVQEVEDNMELIRQPHWTNTWGVSACANTNGLPCENINVVYGTRELNCAGYLIVSNYNNGPNPNVKFTFWGLPFTNASVTDLLTGQSYTITNSILEVSLQYDQPMLLKINGLIGTIGASACSTCKDLCQGALAGNLDICATINSDPNHPIALLDCDNGGVSNAVECNAGNNPLQSSDDCMAAINQNIDICLEIGSNMNHPLASKDCDNGGLPNLVECLLENDPNDPLDDNLCPVEPCEQAITNNLDICVLLASDPSDPLSTLDCDGDGVLNLTECTDTTDPQDPCSYDDGSITEPVTADQSVCPCTDLAMVVTLLPGTFSGTSTVGAAITVTEIDGLPTDGTSVKVRIPSDPRLIFNWDPSLTMAALTPVNNAAWNYLGNNGIFHEFVYSSVLQANGNTGFGFVGTYDPQNTDGQTTLTATIFPFSGGECDILNNVDSERAVYFR